MQGIRLLFPIMSLDSISYAFPYIKYTYTLFLYVEIDLEKLQQLSCTLFHSQNLVLPRASVRPGQALAGRGLACVGPARGRPGRGNSLVLARGQATGRTFVFLIGRATIGPGPVRPIA